MTSRERTLKFLKGEPVDRRPFHPIVMRWAARYAGADCVGIGDAFCSQIGPDLYREFAFDREKKMVDHIHSLGAIAKLHICGNTTALLPDMIRTGADIVDVDHLVPTMEPFSGLL